MLTIARPRVRFTVRPHRPMRRLVLAFGAIVLLGLAGWLLYDYGQWRYIYARMNAAAEQRDVWTLMRSTEAENLELRDRIAVLERGNEIDESAHRELKNLVAQLQDEVLTLKEEVEFYRKILSSSETNRGMAIQGLHVRSAGTDGLYAFQLVLTRLVKDDSLAKGEIDFSIEGQRAGHEIKLSLAATTSEKREKIPFEFKNFQRIEGTLTLPSDFHPVRVRVVLTEHKRERPSAIQTFEWSRVLERVGENPDVG
jgi:hypothetical protein